MIASSNLSNLLFLTSAAGQQTLGHLTLVLNSEQTSVHDDKIVARLGHALVVCQTCMINLTSCTGPLILLTNSCGICHAA